MEEEILITVSVDTDKETAELAALEDSIESLGDEKKELNATTEKNTKAIKKNKKETVSATDAIKNMNPALGGAIGAIKTMTLAAKAFIATPLGLVIGAIGLALGALIGFFKNTQRGADQLSVVSAALGAVFDEVIDTVSALGEIIFEAISNPKQLVIDLGNLVKTNLINRFKAFGVIARSIIKIFSKDWKEGLKELGEGAVQLSTGIDNIADRIVNLSKRASGALEDITERILEEAKAAAILQEATNKLRDQTLALSIVEAERRKRIQELIFITRLETGTQEERRQALVEANEQESKSLQDALNNQRERIRILTEQQALGENLFEDDKKLAEEKIKLIQLETNSLSRQRELLNRINELETKFRSEDLKQETEDQKRAEIQRESAQELQLFRLEQQAELALTTEERIQAEIDKEILKTGFLLENDALLNDERILLQEQLAANIAAIQTAALEDRLKREKEAAAKQSKADKKLATEKIKSEKVVTSAIASTLGERSNIGKAASVLAQKGLIAETFANTEAAAIAAFKSFAGIPVIGTILGAAAAAAVITAGAISVAKIAGLDFFGMGGAFTVGGKRHSSGGTKFVGSDGSKFEAERGENLYILNRSASSEINSLSSINQRHGGRSFSTGGSGFFQAGGAVTENQISTIERRIRGNQELLRIIRQLPPPEVNVVKVSRAQNEVEIATTRANV